MALSKDKQVDLLVALLECDVSDLTALEGCRIDMLKIVEKAKETSAEFGTEVDFNTLTWAMFEIAKAEVKKYIRSTVNIYRHTLEQENQEDEHSEEDREWMRAAVTAGEQLDIFEDTDSSHAGAYVKIYLTNNADKYRKYFEDALDHFEIITGYQIEG
ncbi:hypothetical protein Goe25_02190 [Bacillus phage vB_BsuM-Goe25]|nr:hypothetical protein Goe25_02190 [Bacillus phage vB_BsuM-Goe25]